MCADSRKTRADSPEICGDSRKIHADSRKTRETSRKIYWDLRIIRGDSRKTRETSRKTRENGFVKNKTLLALKFAF